MAIIKNDLWSCIKRTQKEIYKYNTQTWNPQELYDYPSVSVSYLDKAYLSDSINPWDLFQTPANMVTYIVAQTGAGKTSLIYRMLIPGSVKVKKKVLYLCSRSALCTQQKKIAMKDKLNGDLKVNGVEVKNLGDYYTDKGLSEQINFGGIDILTFQAFMHNKSLKANDYAFVVIDESHFFVSDSTFNPFTEAILEKIITTFAFTKRVYLTATPQECLHEIWQYEKAIIPKLLHKPSFMKVYCMQQDYSYLVPYFFTHENEIINLITSRPKESWLIFVREKAFGNELRDKLLKYVSYIPEIITAETKDSEIYNDLLLKEKMPSRIIISTKVIDVGINVKNLRVNVVLFEGPDIVEAKQMIGRKRIDTDKGETLKVYFHTPDVSTLKKRTKKLEDSIKKTEGLINSLRAGAVMEYLEHPLYFDGSNVQVNNFHLKKLKSDLKTHKEIISFLEQGTTTEEQNLLYAEWVLSHFEEIVYDKSKLFLRNPSEEAKEFLESYVGKILSKTEFPIFASKLVEIMGEIRVKERTKPPAIGKVNEMIIPIGFEVKKLPAKSPVQYKITRLEDIFNEQV